jgi:hypothetical protein
VHVGAIGSVTLVPKSTVSIHPFHAACADGIGVACCFVVLAHFIRYDAVLAAAVLTLQLRILPLMPTARAIVPRDLLGALTHRGTR